MFSAVFYRLFVIVWFLSRNCELNAVSKIYRARSIRALRRGRAASTPPIRGRRQRRRFLMIGGPPPIICRRAADATLMYFFVLLHFPCFAWLRYYSVASVRNISRHKVVTHLIAQHIAQFNFAFLLCTSRRRTKPQSILIDVKRSKILFSLIKTTAENALNLYINHKK